MYVAQGHHAKRSAQNAARNAACKRSARNELHKSAVFSDHKRTFCSISARMFFLIFFIYFYLFTFFLVVIQAKYWLVFFWVIKEIIFFLLIASISTSQYLARKPKCLKRFRRKRRNNLFHNGKKGTKTCVIQQENLAVLACLTTTIFQA